MLATVKQKQAGGPHSMYGFHEKSRAMAEMVAGMGLMSLPWWAHVTDLIIPGLHVVTALCGTIIGMTGVYRLFFRKKRRSSDRH